MKGLIVYPNPTFETVNIETDLCVETVNIFNFYGHLVQVETTKKFSISQLVPGVYILNIKTDIGIIREQLFKE